MADDRQSPSPGVPPSPPPSTPAPGEAYGSGQGAPPPATHPYGSPPREDEPGGRAPGWAPPQLESPPYGQPPQSQEPWRPQPAPSPPATTEQVALAGRLARLALMSAVAAPLVTLLDLPYTAVIGLGLSVLAIVLGVRARRAAAAARRSEAGGVVAVVLGSIGTAFIAVVVAFYLVLWGEFRMYENCMSGANTKQAESACSERLIDDARRRVGLD